MIDAHLHVVPPNLPGAGSLSPLLESAEATASALRKEMHDAGVAAALAMGSCFTTLDDPLGVNGTLAVARHVPGLHAIGVADPVRGADPDHMHRVEAVVAAGQVRALKLYLGYLHFAPTDPGYRPYYELAERRRLPVIFHTGDTYSPKAKLRFAQPLPVDDAAVDHPKACFVLAHFGNPWLMDAAEVVYKNVNVWADLSGFVVGGADAFAGAERKELLAETAAELSRAYRYAERPNRFLYGSDWPLAPMTAYRDFIASAIPESHQPLVFEENARLLFRL
ncbi:MAG TPA: amidohydrolase family protein [Gemmataceae bacterium]|nr:amidohydrolase family protein [Gemmataceae bacterium]